MPRSRLVFHACGHSGQVKLKGMFCDEFKEENAAFVREVEGQPCPKCLAKGNVKPDNLNDVVRNTSW